MTGEAKTELEIRAKWLAEDLSKERPNNPSTIPFRIDDIIPLSAETAAVYFVQDPSGLKTLALMYWIAPTHNWLHVILTDSHLLGMSKIDDLKCEVERYNFEITANERPARSRPKPEPSLKETSEQPKAQEQIFRPAKQPEEMPVL